MQAEIGESDQYVYISPKGCRFASSKAACANAGKEPLLDTAKQLEELCEVRRLATKLPTLSDDMLEEQRSAFEAAASSTADAQASAEPADTAVETRWVDTAQTNPQAQWQHVTLPSARLAERIREFEASADHPDPEQRGFKLAEEQRAICRWFGNALDVALDEEIRQIPVNQRKQSACLLIGAGGTGKTTIILQLLLPIFLQYFPAVDGEDRYAENEAELI